MCVKFENCPNRFKIVRRVSKLVKKSVENGGDFCGELIGDDGDLLDDGSYLLGDGGELLGGKSVGKSVTGGGTYLRTDRHLTWVGARDTCVSENRDSK